MHTKLIFILVFMPVALALQISEIMYDPEGGDAGREWIEIYNNDTDGYNLTGWKLNTDNTNHTLNVPPEKGGQGTMNVTPGEYIVIAQNASLFLTNYSFNGTVIDSSWSDLLNSGNETIWIWNITNVLDNITYYPIAQEGNSTCLINGSFFECIPTPGAENSLGQTFITPSEPNQTSNQTQNQTNAAYECDMSAEIKTGSDIYPSNEAINFDIFLNDTICSNATVSHNVTVDYFIEDIFGNIAKPLLNTTRELVCSSTINNRQWTPSDVVGSEVYYIKGSIIDPGCNETDTANNNATKILIVKGNATEQIRSSSIGIKSIDTGSDGKIKYGETANIEIEVYKGDTSKYAIDIWVQNSSGNKLSDVSTIHTNSKFTSYTFKVPVQMKSNCDSAFSDGTYSVVAEGLGTNDTESIVIEGVSSSTCKTITISSGSSSGGSSSGGSGGSTTTSTAQNTQQYEIINYTLLVEIDKEFSTTVKINNNFTKAKNFTVYSYVFKGNNPVSLGLDSNNTWRATYTANSQKITLNALKSVTTALTNKIENGTELGVYSLRVRIKADEKENDITREIVVVENKNNENVVAPEIVTVTISNVTLQNEIESNESEEEQNMSDNNIQNILTGMVFERNTTIHLALFSSPIIVILELILGVTL